MTKISVIIPVYNVDKYLKACLDSVIGQDYSEYEIICVNDGSTDNSLDILLEYEKQSANLHVYSKENGGLSSARNYGIEKAKGTYLFFLDSDDMLADKDCLSCMVYNMEKYSLDILYFDGASFFETEQLRERNKVYETAYRRSKCYGIFENGYKLLNEMLFAGDYYVSACLQCLRKSFVDKNNLRFVDGLLYEDNLFSFKGIMLAGNVMHENRVVLSRRIREGSIMQSTSTFHNFYSLVYTYQEMFLFYKNYKKKFNLDKAVSVLLTSVKNAASRQYTKLDEMEKSRLKELPEYEEFLIRSIFLPKVKQMNDNHIFPYHLFCAGDRVAIYGAGNIGKKFYYKANLDALIDVVGIVDAKAVEMELDDIPVLPVSMIKQLEYDYILIAVENREIAASIRENLIDMGISDNQIMWEGDVYYKKNYYEKAYQFNKFMKRQLKNDSPQFWLFMLPEHGNLGDYAIGYAEQKFFKDYFPENRTICVTTQEWQKLQETFKEMVKKEDVIFISGGGFFGNIWASGNIAKEIIESFPCNRKIYLPNNLTYKDNNWNEDEVVQADMGWLTKQQNTHILFREQQSYEFVKKFTSNCICVPDMALYLHFPRNQVSKEEKILLCMRNDCERIFNKHEELIKILKSNGYQYDEFDIHLKKRISQDEGEKHLRNIIEKIQSYSLVITDRLHGMILSTVSDVPCIAFDNLTHKVSGVYEWIKDNRTVRLFDESELEKLPYVIKELTELSQVEYQIDEKAFLDMAKYIEKILLHEV